MRRSSGDEKAEEFLRWAAEFGISDAPTPSPSSCLGTSLVLSHFPDAGGRGLAAARDLVAGERVLTVPKAALLTSRTVLAADTVLAASVARYPKLSPAQILTVCLLVEVGKGRFSQWYLYISQLPRIYDTLANFSQFEREYLQVEDAIWTSKQVAARVHSEWEEALDLLREIGINRRLSTFKSWLWASATVSSRALHLPWDKAGCLCPVGDLFNYAAPGNDVEQSNNQRLTDGGYDEKEAAYCFYARKSYKKGDQVLLCYGTYTNLELLEHYGFLLSSNPSDKVFIPIDHSIWSFSSWPSDSVYVQGEDGRPSFALFATLRLWAAPLNLRRTAGHLAFSGLQISEESEVCVMKWLEGKCQDVLAELPTDFEEDSMLLEKLIRLQQQTSNINSDEQIWKILGIKFSSPLKIQRKSLERFKLALQWRLSYKRSLMRCISYCNDKIHSFDSKIAD